MTFKVIGPFGIFKLEDIQRATPVETSELTVEINHTPKTHIEDFKFAIVQKTLIQVQLVVKSYDDVEGVEKFIDTTNERTTQRFIHLDEENALRFFGFDKETAPPKSKPTEALTKERATGINVRIWIKRHKDYLRKRAEYDEAHSAMTVVATDPNYAEEFAKVLKKQPSEQETNDFATFAPRIINAMVEKMAKLNKEDEDFIDTLAPLWNKQDGNPTLEARRELLQEYNNDMFAA